MAETLPQRSHNSASRLTRKRGGIYYFRRRVPNQKGAEVTVSLRTTNYREAEHLAERLEVAFNIVLRSMPPTADLQQILSEYLRDALDIDTEARLSAGLGGVYSSPGAGDLQRDATDTDVELLSYLLSDAHEARASRNFQGVAGVVGNLMRHHGVPEDQRSSLAMGILEANVKLYGEMRRRSLGESDLILQPLLPPSSAPMAAALAPPSGPKLSELLPTFLDYSVKEKGWRGQTLAQNSATFAMFTECCGDKPVSSYTRRDLASFYDLMRSLPALYAKDARWRDLPLKEAAERSKDVAVARLTMKTVKRHFSALGGFFTFAKKRGEFEGENPAHGFDFPTKGRGGSKERKMWTSDLLTKLFASPVWTGCHAYFRSKPGPNIVRDDKFWLPLLGLYQGNRLEEFAQLRREDVQQVDGIWLFNISDAGERQLKNEQSRRRVPLHPEVLQLGFMEYLDSLPNDSSAPVFPELRPGGPDKKLGFYFTKWWTEYRRHVGVYQERVDYHSFRHGVTTKLFAAGVQRELIDELTGHEGHGISQTEYLHGDQIPIARLRDAIAAISWPELDLSKLRQTS